MGELRATDAPRSSLHPQKSIFVLVDLISGNQTGEGLMEQDQDYTGGCFTTTVWTEVCGCASFLTIKVMVSLGKLILVQSFPKTCDGTGSAFHECNCMPATHSLIPIYALFFHSLAHWMLSVQLAGLYLEAAVHDGL